MIKISLVRSPNGCLKRQKDNLRSLNLKRIGDSAEFEEVPSTLGRIRKIAHLVRVEVL